MRLFFQWGLFLSFLAAGGAGAFANSAPVHASVSLVRPLRIQQTQELSFGAFVPGGGAGTVSVDRRGTQAQGVSQLRPGQRAAFSVSGQPQRWYQVLLPREVTLSAGSRSMIARLSSEGMAGAFQRSLQGNGRDEWFVDGVLNVGAGQVPGIYRGVYHVQIHY